MGLDVYVMPLWKFKIGDYVSPMRRHFGNRVKTIGYTSTGEVQITGTQSPKTGLIDQWKAKWAVRSIRKEVEFANDLTINWNDNGDCVYAEQFHGSRELKLFARWLNCRDQLPEFSPPENGNYDNHPAANLKPSKPYLCPQLIKHDCWAGYLLPNEFEAVTQVEPYMMAGKFLTTRSVGSSVRVWKELAIIQEHFQVPDDYAGGHPLNLIFNAHQQMKTVTELSIRHQLPVIFFG
ncbi:MAG: hypothetical protein WCT04_16545 [Planctomycetota bacterium]